MRLSVLNDCILSTMKSEKKSNTRGGQRRHYEVTIPYGTYGDMDTNRIVKKSTCTCPAKKHCKHIFGTLLHARDLDKKLEEKLRKEYDSLKKPLPKVDKKKRRYEQVLAEFDDPRTKKRKCLVRVMGERFDSNLIF